MRSNYTAKLFLFNLPVFVLASLLGAAAFAQPACDPGFTDDDTIAAVTDVDDDNDGLIEICNLAGLNHIRHNLAGTSYKDSSTAAGVQCGASSATDCTGYELVKDLDFEDDTDTGYDVAWTVGAGGAGWPPIGDATTPFSGSFDGGEYVIRNLFINRSDEDYVGMFGYLGLESEVKNLGVVGLNISGHDIVGGIAGRLSGKMTSCYSAGSVTGHSSVGGLVGRNTENIISCYAVGTVTGGAGSSNVGGLVGIFANSADGSGDITACYAVGTVTGGTGSSNVGGLVGKYSPSPFHFVPVGRVVTFSYWDKGISGTDASAAGAGKTTAQMKALTASDFGAQESDWGFGNNTQYPALKKGGTVVAGQPCPRAKCGPLVSIAAGTLSVTEGTAAVFTLTRTGSTVGGLTVAITVTGGDGFLSAAAPPEVTFSDGEATVTLSLATEGDNMDEADGTVTVTITADTSSYRGGDASASVDIADDDPILVSITGPGTATAEGMGAAFTLMRARAEGVPLAVKVTVDDGAGDFLTDPLVVTEGDSTTTLALVSGSVTVTIAADQDSQTFTVSTDDDTADEADGMIEATVTAVDGGTYRVDDTDSASVAVTDDDLPLVSIAGGSSVTEGTDAEFTLARVGDTTVALTVTVTVTGSTGFISGMLPTGATFGVDEAMITLTIPTVGDEVDEEDGTITVAVQKVANSYRVDSDNGSAEVTVEDDDLVEVSISGGDAVTEGESAEFTVTRVGDTTEALTVMVAVDDGTGDFLTTSTTSPMAVEIPATQVTKTLSVDTEDDARDEEDGVITATIAESDSTYRLGTSTAMVAVMDDDVVPSAPAGLTAPSTDTTSVSLAWTAVTADPLVTGYQVKVSSVAAGAMGVTGWMDIMNSDATTASYTVTGLTAFTAYTLAIRAQNPAGDGEVATIDATTAAEPPGAPTSLMAGTPTSTTVPLTWTVATTGGDATAFQFKVSHADGSAIITDWTDIMNSDATTSSYTVTGLTAETAYTFAIRSKNSAGESAGVTATATTATAPTSAPATPSGLLAPAAETTSTSVGLTWRAAAADADISAYQVKVNSVATGATGVTAWTDIMNSDVTTSSYTVTGLTAETAYTFAIRAKNTAGESDEVTVTATTAAEPPGAPTALMAGTPTSTTVPLTWTVATTGGDATAFQFKVSHADGSAIITDWTDIMNSDATTASYTVTGLTAETAYTFAVRAKNSAGDGEVATIDATTATAPTTPPAVPSGLLAPAAETTSTSVGLTWTAAVTDADISAYQVQVSNADGMMVITAWMNIMGSSVTTTSYTVTGLTAETSYTFAIRAKNTAGESDEVTVTATTKAASATLSFGSETIDDETYTEDTEIPPLTLPEATGGTGPYTYTLTPVPAGLEFDAGTRILSGMPSTATDTATTHTYTVTDTATTLTAALMFTITVNAAGTFGIGSQGSAVHVYPNPAGDVLHIEFSGDGEYGIALLTLTGQHVLGEWHAGGGTRKLDVSTLKGGVYFLKVEDRGGVLQTFRIIR